MSKKTLFILLISIIASQGICAFMRGADISIQTRQDEGDEYSDGVIYREYGVAKDALAILQNHDLDWIRIRLFHTPDSGDYGASMDLDYVASLGARVKASGFKFLLCLHYSDTWADAGHQSPPAAWNGMSHAQLVTAVQNYTSNVISTLRSNGAMPDMVQIGNETTCGMLWPDGEICTNGNWANYAELINAAKNGINDGRGNEPMPLIMIHIDRGGSQSDTQYFFDNLLQMGVQFDVIGQSFYPEWHGTLDDLSNCVDFMAQNYAQDIVYVEIGDYYREVTGKTPESQKIFVEEVISRVEAAPNSKGRGVFYWEPTWTWNSTNGYKALFEPTIDEWNNEVWDDVEMLMAMEAFHITDKYSTYSTSVEGSVSGTIMDGHNSDDVYEIITERSSGGKPSNRYSYLEHKWTINKISGDATFKVEAYKTSNSENDDFVFAYSTDDLNYTDMLTVTKTSDNDTVQSYTLPGGTIGTVYIRVKDTDQTAGNNVKDKIYIDDMYISVTAGEPDTTPPTPDPMTWSRRPYPTGPSSIAMEATLANDTSGVEYFFDCTAGGCNDSGWQSSRYYEDTGLAEDTNCTYTVKARDMSPNLNETAASTAESATTFTGDPVTVQNHSFEDDGLHADITPTGWIWNGSGARGTIGESTDGFDAYYQGNNATLHQTTSRTIADEGIKYMLAVDVINTWQASPKAIIYYDDGGNRVELASASLPANGDVWPNWDTIEVAAFTTSASVGKNIGIELSIDNYPGDYWSNYDNVRMYGGQDQGCVAATIHVDSIVCDVQTCGGPNRNGLVTVTVVDNCGDPVSGVTVDGTFTGSYGESKSSVTNGSGVATLVTSGCVKKPSYTFCVDNLVDSLPYNSSDNVETCDTD